MDGYADTVTFDERGLVPAVVQESASGTVLLLGYMNRAALAATFATGELHLWSRSRGQLWRKGEQSGHRVLVDEVRVNCEGNSLLVRARLEGSGACHDGYYSCYYRRLEPTGGAVVIEERRFDPAVVYAESVTPGVPNDLSGASTVHPDAAAATTAPRDTAAAAPCEEVAVHSLEQDLRALYAGYERLRDEDFTATSRTSRLLRTNPFEAEAAIARASQELDELRGVLSGTHRHTGGEEDVLLEASQVGYWILVAAIGSGLSYDAWLPHTALRAGWAAPVDATSSGRAAETADESLAALPARLRAVLSQVGALCRQAGVHPGRAVARDLAELRDRHGALRSSST